MSSVDIAIYPRSHRVGPSRRARAVMGLAIGFALVTLGWLTRHDASSVTTTEQTTIVRVTGSTLAGITTTTGGGGGG